MDAWAEMTFWCKSRVCLKIFPRTRKQSPIIDPTAVYHQAQAVMRAIIDIRVGCSYITRSLLILYGLSMGMVEATRLLLIRANSEVKVHYEKYNGHEGPEHFMSSSMFFFFRSMPRSIVTGNIYAKEYSDRGCCRNMLTLAVFFLRFTLGI